jgi:hypothetical protein
MVHFFQFHKERPLGPLSSQKCGPFLNLFAVYLKTVGSVLYKSGSTILNKSGNTTLYKSVSTVFLFSENLLAC